MKIPRALLFLFFFGCLIAPFPLAAQEGWEQSLEQVAELPVRFNGRVSQIRNAAESTLLRLSGRDFATLNSGGKKVNAVSWLLDLMSESDDRNENEVFPIDSPSVADFFEIDERAGWSEKDAIVWVAPSQFESRIEKLETEVARASDLLSTGAELNDFDNKVLELGNRFSFLISLSQLQSFPVPKSSNELVTMVQAIDQLDPYATFQVIPPREGKSSWESILRAGLTLAVRKAAEPSGEIHPPTLFWRDLLNAYKSKDLNAFQSSLNKYQSWLDANPLAKSALQYRVPERWRETGVRGETGATPFNAIVANGDTVAEFDIGSDSERIKAYLRHFTGETMPDVFVYNDWRIGFGLSPLAPEDLKKSARTIKVAGQSVLLHDLVPHEDVATPFKRIVGSVIRRGEHTFLFNAGLPEQVSDQLDEIESFLASLRLGTVEELDDWFVKSKPSQLGLFQTKKVALIMDGQKIWSVLLIEHERLPSEKSQRKVFQAFLDSVQQSSDEQQSITWQLPAGWQRDNSSQPMTFFPRGPIAAEISIYVSANSGDFLPLVNHWRMSNKMPAWSRTELNAAAEKSQINGLEVLQFGF